ncbi:uncharacterized protein [Dermacentor albipictus]|uniref:uncharacterized protein n=1 Tax=Dermacentor albipictus TaxID=60249 RepID=UPI0031FE0514
MLVVGCSARLGQGLRLTEGLSKSRKNLSLSLAETVRGHRLSSDDRSSLVETVAQRLGYPVGCSTNSSPTLSLLRMPRVPDFGHHLASLLVAPRAPGHHILFSWHRTQHKRGFSTVACKEPAFRFKKLEGTTADHRGCGTVVKGRTAARRIGPVGMMGAGQIPCYTFQQLRFSTHDSFSSPIFTQPSTQKSRCRDSAERAAMQGGQKLALPPWMTAKRPYFLSDCERAFKCIKAKIRETTSWDQFLDLGCGAGELTRCIVKEFGGLHRIIVATERSPDVIKVLRRNAAQRDILYEVLDVERDVDEALSSWGQFRRIFSLYHLESVRDKQRALNNIRRLLWEQGGELFLMFRVHSNLMPLYKLLADEGRWTEVAADYKAFLLKLPKGDKWSAVMCKMMENAGFKVKVSKLLETNWRLSSTESLDELIMGTCPVLHRVTPELREEFVRDCAQAAAQVLPRSGDELTFSYTTFVAWAEVDPAKATGDVLDTLAARFFKRRRIVV